MSHDPLKFITGLGSKLATRSRHVCWFFGAGTSRACGLPDVKGLTEKVLAALDGEQRSVLEGQLKDRNLEQALSRVRAIKSLLSAGQDFEGLTADKAAALDAAICGEIVKALTTSEVDLVPVRHFAVWASRARYASPVEVFTVNYDLLVERALDKHRVLYFDGFSGVVEGRFQIELAEAFGPSESLLPSMFSRLWKLHGSVNWSWDGAEIVRLGAPVQGGRIAAIYPSELKYEESRRFPFVVLQDRFRRALNQPETLLLITGYSFGDQHLNELIFDAAERHQRSEVVAFIYGDLPDELVQRAEATPNFQLVGDTEAVLSGVKGCWKLPEGEENAFFVDGKLTLTDFAKLTYFLSRSSAMERDRDPGVRELLRIIAERGAGGEG